VEEIPCRMTPEFQEEAAAVAGSPYFRVPSIEDARAQVAAAEKLGDEKWVLIHALARCRDYADLAGEAKAIFDRAKKAITG
jgi:hypothetical protein